MLFLFLSLKTYEYHGDQHADSYMIQSEIKPVKIEIKSNENQSHVSNKSVCILNLKCWQMGPIRFHFEIPLGTGSTRLSQSISYLYTGFRAHLWRTNLIFRIKGV
jgi:hypothetical protein